MNYKDFTKLELPNIEENQKVTIIKQSEFGFPIAIQIKFKKMYLKDYAQYKDCLRIVGIPNRKRKVYEYLIRPYQDFKIINGWVEIHDYTKKTFENESVKVTSLGFCFDEENLKFASDVDAEVLLSTF